MLARIAAWFRKYRGPHKCLECGRPLTYGHNEAGRWWVACGKMNLTLGDGYLSTNHRGHTVRVTESEPEWSCDHDHVERDGYSPTVGWWE